MTARRCSAPKPVLERLAVLPTSAAERMQTDWVDDTVTSGMLIVVAGALDAHDRGLLARLHQRGNAAYAVAIDVDSWLGKQARASVADRPNQSKESSQWLRQHGWKAATLARGESLPAAWQ